MNDQPNTITIQNTNVWRRVNELLTTKGIANVTSKDWDDRIVQAVYKNNMLEVAAIANVRMILNK